MPHNLEQLLSEFDEFVATYFLELSKFDDEESNLFFQKKIEKLNFIINNKKNTEISRKK